MVDKMQWRAMYYEKQQELADLKERHAELEEEYDRLDSARGELWFELKNLKQLVGDLIHQYEYGGGCGSGLEPQLDNLKEAIPDWREQSIKGK